MARPGQPHRQGEGGRLKWRTVIIPISTVQFWVTFLVVLVVLSVLAGLGYYQFLSPKAEARRLIARAQVQYDQAVAMGLRELAYQDYRAIEETLFQARKAYDGSENTEAAILAEQALSSLDKAIERLRSDEYFRRDRSASVSFFRGTVEVQAAGSLGWQPVGRGLKLRKGDRVRTRGGSSCVVQFDDGSQLTIKSDSLVHIDDLSEDVRTHTKNSAIKLLVSDVEASILRPTAKGSRFLIETPGAVAQVLKARMNIRVGEDNQTEYQLLSGDVSVEAGGQTVRLAENEVVNVGREGKVTSRGRLPGVPALRAPANLHYVATREKTSSMPFSWDAVEGAAAYRLVIGTDRYFTTVVYDNGKLSQPAVQVGGLGPGLYFWRVSSVDRAGRESLASPFRAFRVSQDLTPPFLALNDPIVLKGEGVGRVLVSGALEPGSRLEVDGQAAPLSPDGTFRFLRDLAPGQEALVVRARDGVGNEFEQARGLR